MKKVCQAGFQVSKEYAPNTKLAGQGLDLPRPPADNLMDGIECKFPAFQLRSALLAARRAVRPFSRR